MNHRSFAHDSLRRPANLIATAVAGEPWLFVAPNGAVPMFAARR
jgi:hypothetical protein